MRGNTENGVEGGGEEGEGTAPTDVTSGERRPSVVALQNMLKKVSQSPFQNQNKDSEYRRDLSAAAAAMDVNGGQSGGVSRKNPFYAYYLESGSKPQLLEEAGRKTSEDVNFDAMFDPTPEFQSSPLKMSENGGEFPKPQSNLHQTRNSNQDLFPTSTLSRNSTSNGHFYDMTPNSTDLFNPAQTQNLSNTLQPKNLFEGEAVSRFQAARGEDLLHTTGAKEVNLLDKSPNIFVDSFKSSSNKEEDLFQPPQPAVGNPFYTATNKEADLFHAPKSEEVDIFSKEKDLFGMASKKSVDIFSTSSASTVDPFPSPVTRSLFQDASSLSDPFGATPSKQYDPDFSDVSNGTPDIFQPLPSKTTSRDLSEITRSLIASKAPSLSSLSQTKSPDLVKKTPSGPPPAVPPKPFQKPPEAVLTTPQGTEIELLQPTPPSRASSASPSPPDMTHVQTFKRPPKPLPRTRAPKTDKPPKPEKPPQPEMPPQPTVFNVEPEPAAPKTPPKPSFRSLNKPVIRRKPKTQESKPVEPENFVVFEDILLIGQEHCVEDWPEDSPQLHPSFKPSGKLRLRRESLKTKVESDGGSGEDLDGTGSHIKKKDKKFRMSLLSRRGSKDKFPDDTKEGRSRTLPIPRKSSKEYFSEINMSAGENEYDDQNGMDYKKKPLKTKVNQLLRRASTSYMSEGKRMNGHVPQDSKDNDKKIVGKKESVIRRSSEGTVLDDSTAEDEENWDDQHEEKKKKKMKIKFVPQRGFAISMEKTNEEPKGAHGYTPRKSSKEKSPDEVYGAHGYTPHKKYQDDDFEDVEELKSHSLQSASKAAFMEDEHLQKMHHFSNGDEDDFGIQDTKPKKTGKIKLPHRGRRSSKENMLDETSPQKKKSSFSAEELDYDELNGMEDGKVKSSKHKAPPPVPRKPKSANGQSELIGSSYHSPQHASSDAFEEEFLGPGEMYDDDQEDVETFKPKKLSKLKGLKKHKNKNKAAHVECEDPPGATSSDYLSEAARAEWLAAQKDERAMAGLEDEDEEGDTDSLMEWWNTVEQWDEVPSDDENDVIEEDESKSFSILADKVHRGLRVFNKVFTERAEVLWQSIIVLHAIADDISEFHHKAKIAGITGGTTTAVGGVAAIAGLALAPITFGASLVITAVGVGVAAAGGITSASAAISDNVNNMNDRKKVEVVLQDYENHLLDIGKILHFINQGMYKLRGHPFLRSGTQHYSEDWEIRRAVQMISLVDSPVMRATEITDGAVASLQGLFKGMDKYFLKDSRELKKGCKKEMVCQIKEVANVLNDGIVELNAIREELQEATGSL